MIIISVESSHTRGMGHFYRMLNFTSFLSEKHVKFHILINNNYQSIDILKEKEIPYTEVDYDDISSNWEKRIINKYKPDIWLSDKCFTGIEMARNIKAENIPLAVIDDRGEGATISDVHFVGMMFDLKTEDIGGENILRGLEYNILNPEISQYRHKREKIGKILVTLGGSDTYGATVKVVKSLKNQKISADIIVGANFTHNEELEKVIGDSSEYNVYTRVSSMIETMSHYDLAITGGGVTPLEACASGLPCLVVANEIHEIATAEYLEEKRMAKYIGYCNDLSDNCVDLSGIDIQAMSDNALEQFPLDAMEKILLKLNNIVFYQNRNLKN